MMLNRLREETQQLHKEIEKDNLAGRIISHEISLEEYKLLLLQNFIAYKITEEKIAEFLRDYRGGKHLQLEKDLKELGVGHSLFSTYKKFFTINSEPEAYGAAYVVEGSALGGMLIAKEINACEKLYSIRKHHFFSGERDNLKGWKAFSKAVKSREFSEEEKAMAAKKAKETFEFFGRVFSLKREHVL